VGERQEAGSGLSPHDGNAMPRKMQELVVWLNEARVFIRSSSLPCSLKDLRSMQIIGCAAIRGAA